MPDIAGAFLTVTESLRTMRVASELARNEPNLAPHPVLARTPANRASAFASSSCGKCMVYMGYGGGGGVRSYVSTKHEVLPHHSGWEVHGSCGEHTTKNSAHNGIYYRY